MLIRLFGRFCDLSLSTSREARSVRGVKYLIRALTRTGEEVDERPDMTLPLRSGPSQQRPLLLAEVDLTACRSGRDVRVSVV